MKKRTSSQHFDVPLFRRFVIFSLVLFSIIVMVGSTVFFLVLQPTIQENRHLYLTNVLERFHINLETAVNNEVSVAVQIADSPLIQQFMLDPNNEEIADLAIQELLSRRSAFTSNSIYWMSDVDKIFHVDQDIQYLVDVTDPENYWYYLTLFQTETYNFNINYNPDLDAINLWINVPIFSEGGTPIGMVGTGINLTTFVERIFKDHDSIAYVYLFNAKGEITGTRDIDMISEKENITSVLSAIHIDPMIYLPSISDDNLFFTDSYDHYVGLSSLPNLEWYIIAIYPITLSDYWIPLTQFFIATLLGIALIILIFNGFIIRLLRPLRSAIEELVNRETEARSKKTKYEILSRISHEIRTPIQAIVGGIISLKRNAEPENLNHQLDQMKQSSTELLGMVDNILYMYDIEHDVLKIESSAFHFHKIMSKIEHICRESAKIKQQHVTFTIDSNIPDVLIGDKKRITQVLLNLLNNAIKFTDLHGKITVQCDMYEEDSDVVHLLFSITDSGIGIPTELHSTIFGMFEQADGGMSRKFGGIGLGLPISKYIIERMNGDLWYESEIGKGTTFYATMQLKQDVSCLSCQNCPQKQQLIGKTILLADDVEINREIIIMMLDDLGIKVDCACNGLEAVDMYTKNPMRYSMIIMDINMPEMDGMEATRQIREFEFDLGVHIPIIAATANILTHEVEKYLEHGMTDHIGKPIEMDLLQRKIKQYLSFPMCKRAANLSST